MTGDLKLANEPHGDDAGAATRWTITRANHRSEFSALPRSGLNLLRAERHALYQHTSIAKWKIESINSPQFMLI